MSKTKLPVLIALVIILVGAFYYIYNLKITANSAKVQQVKETFVKDPEITKDFVSPIYSEPKYTGASVKLLCPLSVPDCEILVLNGVDAKSFQSLGYGYAKDKNKVYYNSGFGEVWILNADPISFSLVDPKYDFAKDSKNVYQYGKSLEGVDSTFVILSDSYFKDKDHVYHGPAIPGADPETFYVYPNSDYAKDKNNFYYGYEAIKNKIDPASFQVLGERGLYAKDKNNVYEFSYLIKGADPASFVLIDEDYYYAKDKNNVYSPDWWPAHMGPLTKSFSSNSGFFEVNNSIVYSLSGQYTDADPVTFQALAPFLAKDKNHVFYTFDTSQPIQDVDVNTFSFLGNFEPDTPNNVTFNRITVYKDNKSVYINGKKINGTDALAYEYIGGGYGKDKNNVYFLTDIISQATPATFKRITPSLFIGDNTELAVDSNSLYTNGKKVSSDTLSLEDVKFFHNTYAVDGKYVYLLPEEYLLSGD